MEIQPILHPITAQSQIETQGVTAPVSAQDLFIVAQFCYLAKVHEVMHTAWEKFRENQSDMREQKEVADRLRERRQAPIQNAELSSHLHFHQGEYRESYTRHLNLPA